MTSMFSSSTARANWYRFGGSSGSNHERMPSRIRFKIAEKAESAIASTSEI